MVILGGTHYMLRDKLHILDDLFLHSNSSSWYNKPTMFDWVRSSNIELTVLTDNLLKTVDNVISKNKIGWLVESPLITKSSYDFVLKNYNKFDKIFTFDKSILDVVENSELLPIGGCWINDEDRFVHNKTKGVSIISSSKNFLPGHKLRHEIISVFNNIDIYGYGYNFIENKIYGLGEYKFSIVVENFKSDYYFTEKLIDCFITGTIPIYWGCPSIDKFFNIDGIIPFNTVNDLHTILNNLDGVYEKKISSVMENFELCKKFLIADDLIYEKIKNINNENQ